MLPSRALPNKASIQARPLEAKTKRKWKQTNKHETASWEKNRERKQTNKQTPAQRSIGALLNEALIHGDWSTTNSLAGNNVWSSDNHRGLPDYPIEILYIYAHVHPFWHNNICLIPNCSDFASRWCGLANTGSSRPALARIDPDNSFWGIRGW